MRKLSKLLIFSSILIGCHKNCPAPGIYQSIFTGTYEIGGYTIDNIGSTSISEISEDSIYIGYSKVEKSGKNITGEIGGPGNIASAKITGVCQKRKGIYYLKGTYRAVTYEGNVINGEFKIYSK